MITLELKSLWKNKPVSPPKPTVSYLPPQQGGSYLASKGDVWVNGRGWVKKHDLSTEDILFQCKDTQGFIGIMAEINDIYRQLNTNAKKLTFAEGDRVMYVDAGKNIKKGDRGKVNYIARTLADLNWLFPLPETPKEPLLTVYFTTDDNKKWRCTPDWLMKEPTEQPVDANKE